MNDLTHWVIFLQSGSIDIHPFFLLNKFLQFKNGIIFAFDYKMNLINNSWWWYRPDLGVI